MNSPDGVWPGEAWLTPREASLFAEIKSPRHQRDWLAGRCAAKELIRDYIFQITGRALACSQIEILNDENGAPRPLLPLNLEISLAHSAGHGLAGLCAHSPLGVDLQQIRPVRSDLIRRVLSEHERAELEQHFAGNLVEGTLVFWALKEAAIKAQKERPAPALPQIAVTITAPSRAEIAVRDQRYSAQWGRWKEFIWAWAVS
ncbi:MAG: 4'-phosphopantetheinyl transferase superfamily protein [Candidatus Bipolaricaulota bacterium]|nr:4'-phosphopantetheinyl transferase superfamily protein [Candidatus Bipolaricaulota bacterium]